MIKRNQYPKDLHIGTEIWAVKFVRKLGKDVVGEADPSEKEIRILCGQSREDTLKTFCHEILHALEMEYDIPVEHKLIYALEDPIYHLLRDNFFTKK